MTVLDDVQAVADRAATAVSIEPTLDRGAEELKALLGAVGATLSYGCAARRPGWVCVVGVGSISGLPQCHVGHLLIPSSTATIVLAGTR